MLHSVALYDRRVIILWCSVKQRWLNAAKTLLKETANNLTVKHKKLLSEVVSMLT